MSHPYVHRRALVLAGWTLHLAFCLVAGAHVVASVCSAGLVVASAFEFAGAIKAARQPKEPRA